MSKGVKFSIFAAALAVAVAMGSAAYADAAHHSESTSGAAPSEEETMGSGTPGGEMMGMMNMMTQMSQMMETCNKMMQSAMQAPGQPPQGPEKGAPTPQQQGG